MRFLLTVLLFTGLILCCSAHEYIFRSTFDNLNPAKHTVAGFGWTQRGDRALVMAKENVADFHAEAAPSVKIPTGNYVSRLKKFPVNGYFDCEGNLKLIWEDARSVFSTVITDKIFE